MARDVDIGFPNSKINAATVELKTLANTSETVAEGFYQATTLSAVDADLATANIKSGVTIFGISGDADVRDISDADAVEGDVASGKTFYAVSGGKRTGTA